MLDATLQILTRLTGSTTADSHCVEKLPVSLALWLVEADRGIAKDTQVHQTTDRDGRSVHVFYTQLAGPWKDVDDVTHIVSVPTAALSEESW
ncbi:hypothetical protein ACWGQ4_08375 [Streptomyces sp. NPDC055721]|uniref:hypothetical protein n=1 Tax=Streptomyces sp. NPDC127132 TaxID=3345374 RepID=UPI00363051B2